MKNQKSKLESEMEDIQEWKHKNIFKKLACGMKASIMQHFGSLELFVTNLHHQCSVFFRKAKELVATRVTANSTGSIGMDLADHEIAMNFLRSRLLFVDEMSIDLKARVDELEERNNNLEEERMELMDQLSLCWRDISCYKRRRSEMETLEMDYKDSLDILKFFELLLCMSTAKNEALEAAVGDLHYDVITARNRAAALEDVISGLQRRVIEACNVKDELEEQLERSKVMNELLEEQMCYLRQNAIRETARADQLYILLTQSQATKMEEETRSSQVNDPIAECNRNIKKLET